MKKIAGFEHMMENEVDVFGQFAFFFLMKFCQKNVVFKIDIFFQKEFDIEEILRVYIFLYFIVYFYLLILLETPGASSLKYSLSINSSYFI